MIAEDGNFRPTRRGFLRMFAGAAAATVAPSYFFAPIAGWKSNVIVNPAGHWDAIVADDLVDVQNILKVYYSKKFIDNLKAHSPFVGGAMPSTLQSRAIWIRSPRSYLNEDLATEREV